MLKQAIIMAFALVVNASASAGTIVSAVDAVVNIGGTGLGGTIEETINQNGLDQAYVSGVTDFDVYLAGNPLHSPDFDTEWFSAEDQTSATVTYNLGALLLLESVALWNEDNSGIGLLNLLYSTDGVTFLPLLAGLMPTNNPVDQPYLADVFAFTPVSAQYIRFEMSNCPQEGGDGFVECAIGEVAFENVRPNGSVPEPASLALLGLGLAGIAGLRRHGAARG